MKPIFSVATIALVTSASVLVSCSANTQVAEGILQQAAAMNSSLNSAEYEGRIELTFTDAQSSTYRGGAAITGVLQNSGKSQEFNVNVNATAQPTESELVQFNSQLSVVVSENQDVFFYVDDLTTAPATELLTQATIDSLIGQWWQLPVNDTNGPTTRSDDSVNMLNIQTEAVKVIRVRDDETIRGKVMHHFDVAIDPNKLEEYLEKSGNGSDTAWADLLQKSDMKGELWIDKETNHIHRVRWNIVYAPLSAWMGSFTLFFQFDLSKHNQAKAVQVPTESVPFYPEFIVEPDPNIPSIPPASPIDDSILSPEQIDV